MSFTKNEEKEIQKKIFDLMADNERLECLLSRFDSEPEIPRGLLELAEKLGHAILICDIPGVDWKKDAPNSVIAEAAREFVYHLRNKYYSH